MTEPLMIAFCTCPQAAAPALAHELVSQRLAACVNVVPAVQSIYQWEGKVESDNEALMILKTAQSRWPELAAWVSEHHPYDVPELLAWPATHGLPDYLAWALGQCHPEAPE